MAGRPWDDRELYYLESQFETLTCEQIAATLGRTTRSVQHKYGQLGLERAQPKIGDTFNRLTIKDMFLKEHYGQKATFATVECSCSKKSVFDVKLRSLIDENTRSCGCLKSEIKSRECSERNYKHGQSVEGGTELYKKWVRIKFNPKKTICPQWNEFLKFEKWSKENGYIEGYHIYLIDEDGVYEPNNCLWHSKGIAEERLYQCWADMIDRCYRINNQEYHCYGGRGIEVCNQWKIRYFTFKNWALLNGYDDDLTIERKDVDGNYEPGNCEWIPLSEQGKNRTNNFNITAFGETKHSYAWSQDNRCTVNSATIIYRIRNGKPPESAITTPSGGYKI